MQTPKPQKMAGSVVEQWLMSRLCDGSDSSGVYPTERRRSRRAPLHWVVYVAGAESTHPCRTEIRDISKDGLNCIIDRPVTPGDDLVADILLPTHNCVGGCEAALLRCRIHVVRVEKTELPGHFGVGCTIQSYELVCDNGDGVTAAVKSSPRT